jgi:hypothetical protein
MVAVGCCLAAAFAGFQATTGLQGDERQGPSAEVRPSFGPSDSDVLAGTDGGDDCNIGLAAPNGLIDTVESTVVDPIFGTYTVLKEVTVCIDPNCGEAGPNDAPPCDPFPEDDRFTYVYRLTNTGQSTNALIGFVIDTTVWGSIVEAGYLAGPGVTPSEIVVNNVGSRVEWRFFTDLVDPGESTVELYIISGRGPAMVDSTVEGDFGLDAPGLCLGPAVPCDECNENEIPDDCETAPDFDPTPPVEAADHCEDAPFICTDWFYESDNIGADNDTVTSCDLIYGGFHDVFYRYRPATSGTAVVKVCESDFPPIISVHSDCPATEDNQITCNFQSSVGQNCGAIWEVEAGETYLIRVAGALDAQGWFQLQVKGPRCLINPTDGNENGIPDVCECLADVNDDGVVDGLDFNQVYFLLGAICEGCVEDINGDGVIDEQDLAIVNSNLGPCPFGGGKALQGPLGTAEDSTRLGDPVDPTDWTNGG